MRESDIERRLVQGVKNWAAEHISLSVPAILACLTGWLFCREA